MTTDHPDTPPDDLRDARTLVLLEQALPRVAPPADLFDRILDGVRAEAKVVPLAAARRSRRTRAWVAGGLAAAAAVVVAVAVGLSLGDEGLGDPDARAAISSTSDSTVHGEAALYGDAGKIVVSLDDVPRAPSGHHYEVWVLPEGSEAMVSLGTFEPAADGEDVTLELDLPAAASYAAVDVSVEEDAGPAAHSDTSYGTGFFNA